MPRAMVQVRVPGAKKLMKCLVVSSPCQEIKESLEKLRQVIEKNGPFTGGCFWLWGSCALKVTDLEIIADTKGFIGKTQLILVAGAKEVLNEPIKDSLRDRLLAVILEPAGFLKLPNGLSIGFVSGEPGPAETSLLANAEHIDLLFSYVYPKGIEKLGEGNQHLAELYASKKISPRYHFALNPSGNFWERVPFMNENGQVTRFIALGNGADGARWHYALDISPGVMKANVTAGPSPFIQHEQVFAAGAKPHFNLDPNAIPSAKRTQEHLQELRQFNQHRNMPEGYVCNHCGSHMHYLRDCPSKKIGEKPSKRATPGIPPAGYVCHVCGAVGHFVQDCPLKTGKSIPELKVIDSRAEDSCWFCLSTETSAKHLVVDVGEEAYMALPRASFDARSVLIITVDHILDPAKATVELRAEMEDMQQQVRKVLKGLTVLSFSFEIRTRNHWHIQMVGVEKPHEQVIAKVREVCAGRSLEVQEKFKGPSLKICVSDESFYVPLRQGAFIPLDLPKSILQALDVGGTSTKPWRSLLAEIGSEEEAKRRETEAADYFRQLLDQQPQNNSE